MVGALTVDRLASIATALELSPLALFVDNEHVLALAEQLADDDTLTEQVLFFPTRYALN